MSKESCCSKSFTHRLTSPLSGIAEVLYATTLNASFYFKELFWKSLINLQLIIQQTAEMIKRQIV
jgi:hypothetical protein